MVRDFRREAHEQWSERNQTLRHAGEKRPRDDRALLHDPTDYSAIGGPENERVYGRTRSDNGSYPWSSQGGQYDRDTPPSQLQRGGYLKLDPRTMRALSPSSAPDGRASPQDRDSARNGPAKSE